MRSLLLCLLLSLLPAIAQEYTYTYGSNLVSNGGFASDITGWPQYGSPSTYEWSVSVDTLSGLLHIITPQNGGTLRQDVPITAGNRYRLFARYYKVTANRATRGVLRTTGFEPQQYDITATEVQEIDSSFIAQNTDAEAWIWIFNASSNTSEFYIDSVSVQLATDSTLIINESTNLYRHNLNKLNSLKGLKP